MFEHFTPEALEVVVDAKNHCNLLDEDCIRAEHLLLAVVTIRNVLTDDVFAEVGLDRAALEGVVASHAHPAASGRGTDAAALGSLGIDVDAVRRQAEAAFGPGALHRPARAHRGRPQYAGASRRRREAGVHLAHDEAATAALEDAPRRAHALGHDRVGTEHLLLALLSYDDTPAATALQQAGADPGQVRAGVLRRLNRAA